MNKTAFIAVLAIMGVVSVVLAHDNDYSRRLYGGWIDADGDCYNTRAEVLLRDNLGSFVQSKSTCRIISGSWQDAYSDKFYENAGVLDIDHLVPLSEAHRSGGDKWTRARRRAYANDESNLFLTHRGLNRSKGGKGIDEWLPPKNVCEYVHNYARTKQKHGLLFRASEVMVLLAYDSCIIPSWTEGN